MNFQVGEQPFTTVADAVLLQTERVVAKLSKGALALPLMLNQNEHGFFLHGNCTLILDAIIETERGAIGDSIEQSLTKPFLMLGNKNKIETVLTPAETQDVICAGYRDVEDFREKARNLCQKLLYRSNSCHCNAVDGGVVFAFQNEDGKLDLLLSNGNKLLYTSKGMTFLQSANKTILKRLEETILSERGKLCVLKRAHM